MVLGAEACPEMPRIPNWSKTVSKGNGPVPQQDEFGPEQLTLGVEMFLLFEEDSINT